MPSERDAGLFTFIHDEPVADRDASAAGDRSVDAAIGMAEAAHEHGGDHQVADCGGRIDRGGSAALGALQAGQGDLADGDPPADPAEFGEGRNAVDIDIGAEADGVDGDARLDL